MSKTKTKVRCVQAPGKMADVDGVLFMDTDHDPMIVEFTYTRSYVTEAGSKRKEDGRARFWAKYTDWQGPGRIGLCDDEGGIWKFAIFSEDPVSGGGPIDPSLVEEQGGTI